MNNSGIRVYTNETLATIPVSNYITLGIITLFVYVLAIIFHCLGVYLLTCCNAVRSIQDVIILNMSVNEILICCSYFAQTIIIQCKVESSTQTYLIVSACLFILLPNFMIMMLLTVNRFLEIYLNIHYNRLITKQNVCKVLFFCWGIGAVCGISLVKFSNESIVIFIFNYILPSFEGILFLLALSTYIYIWKIFKKTKRSKEDNRLLKKNFFTPFFIIISFIAFFIAPDIANLLLKLLFLLENPNISNSLLMLHGIGFICDALIYTFLQRRLRIRLKKQLKALIENKFVGPLFKLRQKPLAYVINTTQLKE
nr:uncharacterized protein LOC124814631 [Hydra vulgaris]